MTGKRRIVPLNSVSEAMTVFDELLIPYVTDVRRERVYCDIGDYVHLMGDEERLVRIRWIYETIVRPQEIRRGHVKSKPFREVYIATVFEGVDDETGTPFIVGVDRRYGRLDFRTAMVPEIDYLQRVMKGKLLWREPESG